MQTDSNPELSIKELVLEDSVQSYLKVTSEDKILTNRPNQEKHNIEGRYPSLIVYLPTGEIVIEEIETESTIVEAKASKWEELANLGHDFRLIVPLSRLELAKRLTAHLTNINIQAYEITGDQVQWFGKNT